MRLVLAADPPVTAAHARLVVTTRPATRRLIALVDPMAVVGPVMVRVAARPGGLVGPSESAEAVRRDTPNDLGGTMARPGPTVADRVGRTGGVVRADLVARVAVARQAEVVRTGAGLAVLDRCAGRGAAGGVIVGLPDVCSVR